MNRRVKVSIAVVLCVIPIAWAFMAWSQPRPLYTHPFSVFCLYSCVDEEVHEVGIAWPDVQMKVVVNVTDILGNVPQTIQTVDIYDSTGNLVRNLTINGLGEYSTNWFLAQGVFNITVRGNGYPSGGFDGQITVYGRGIWYYFIYGDCDIRAPWIPEDPENPCDV